MTYFSFSFAFTFVIGEGSFEPIALSRPTSGARQYKLENEWVSPYSTQTELLESIRCEASNHTKKEGRKQGKKRMERKIFFFHLFIFKFGSLMASTKEHIGGINRFALIRRGLHGEKLEKRLQVMTLTNSLQSNMTSPFKRAHTNKYWT